MGDRFHRGLCVLTAVGLAASVGRANPAPVGASGRMPIPVPPQPIKGIALVSESLLITDGVRHTVDGFAPASKMSILQVSYSGRYWLKNNNEARRAVTIGFPVVEGRTTAGESENGVTDLRVTLQGQPVTPQRIARVASRLVAVSTLREVSNLSGEEIAELTRQGWAKPLVEDPGYLDLTGLGTTAQAAKEKLANSSRISAAAATELVALASGTGDFSFSGELVWFQFEVAFAAGETVQLEVSYLSTRAWEGMPYDFAYVLTTARFWDGPIGRCRIVIEKSPTLPATAYRIVRPAGFVLTDNQRWVFEQRDFVPREDLLVQVEPP